MSSLAIALGMMIVGALFMVAVAQRTSRDPVTILTGYLVALYLIPAGLAVGPLGGAGTPAVLIALGTTWWWLLGRFNPEVGLRWERQPLRPVLGAYIWFCLLSVALSRLRPLSALEARGSIRTVIALFAAAGLALLIADGIREMDRLNTLLRRLTTIGALMALVGIIQFATGWDPTQYIRIPGLVMDTDLGLIGSRSLFNRPHGTALHPIEFGVLCASLVPLGLHFAMTAPDKPTRERAWVTLAIIAAAAPISVSRSAILSLVVGFSVIFIAWSWPIRARMSALAFVFTCVMWAVVPGLVGTIRNLFVNAATDPSVTARQDRVPRVIELWSQSPWVGRGFGTYNLEDYFLLDNEVYRTAIQVGVVGLALTLAVIFVGVGLARGARHASTDDKTRHLGQALAASILALASSMATFDAFYYRIWYGTLFVLIGASAALWAIVRDKRRASPNAPVSDSPALTTRGV